MGNSGFYNLSSLPLNLIICIRASVKCNLSKLWNISQELQNDLDRETSNLQELEAQKQDAQDRLDEMDQQKAKLKDMLNDVKQKCQEETQMVSVHSFWRRSSILSLWQKAIGDSIRISYIAYSF